MKVNQVKKLNQILLTKSFSNISNIFSLFTDLINWATNPEVLGQRLRLMAEVEKSQSRVKIPIPKTPTGIIKASGTNRTTKTNPALVLHQIPNNVDNNTLEVLKHQSETNNFDLIRGPVPNSEEQFINNVIEEMNTTLTLYSIHSHSWMYLMSSYYINFYAYSVPQKLQPNLIAFARDPLQRQWERMKRFVMASSHNLLR